MPLITDCIEPAVKKSATQNDREHTF